MDEFAHIWRVVEPKQRRYENAKRALENSQRVLREAEEKLRALQEEIEKLKAQYAEQVKAEWVKTGSEKGSAPIRLCSFFLDISKENGTINVLGSI